jgi:hypothetical protein
MVWIKRNLFFVLSAVVGFLLVLGAGYYLWTNYSDNSAAQVDLGTKRAELQKYTEANPQPTKEVIAQVKEQQKEVQAVLEKFKKNMGGSFVTTITNDVGLKNEIDRTMAYLQSAATNSGVGLLTPYYFTFAGLINRFSFNSNSILPLTVQLHDVRNICEVLFAAKINALEGIRRVPVCIEDMGGGDFLAAGSVTNDSGIHTPYELTFRAYTKELADVVNGFMLSTNGFVIKNIDYQLSTGGVTFSSGGEEAQPTGGGRGRTRRGFRGEGGGGGYDPAAIAIPTNQGPVTIVSEKCLRVTMVIEIVKPKAQ